MKFQNSKMLIEESSQPKLSVLTIGPGSRQLNFPGLGPKKLRLAVCENAVGSHMLGPK